jgi:AhpC/TSA family
LRPDQLDIAIPEFPPEVEWINARIVRLGTLLGQHAVLVWFWDHASLNSLRALPYVRDWDRRYRDFGLRVFGVHSPQFDFGAEHANVEAAVERLGIDFAVAPDPDFEIWRAYGNEVWPALYLWDRRGVLRYYHFAEGAYDETERAIQELLHEIDPEQELPEPLEPVRDTDRPGALVKPPTPHVYLEPDRSARSVKEGERLRIRFAGAAAAAVLDGQGKADVLLDGEWVRTLLLEGPRLYDLVDYGRHTAHELTLVFHVPARAYAFSFAPGPA